MATSGSPTRGPTRSARSPHRGRSPSTRCRRSSPTRPGSWPGPDGNLWVTEDFLGDIAKISTTGQVLDQYVGSGNFPQPDGITVGPDNNIWFADQGGKSIGQLDISTGTMTQFPVPGSNPKPTGITTGPGGNLWFTDQGNESIGVLNIIGIPDAHTDPDTDADTHADTDADTDTDAYTDTHSDAYSDTYSDADTHTDAIPVARSRSGAPAHFGRPELESCPVREEEREGDRAPAQVQRRP